MHKIINLKLLTEGQLEEPNLTHLPKMKGRNDQKADAQAGTPAMSFIYA